MPLYETIAVTEDDLKGEESMNCTECGVEVEETSGNEDKKFHIYVPVNRKLSAIEHNIPFCCKTCGAIKFPYQAVRDVVFIWSPDPEKIGNIWVPEIDAERHRTAYGIILSVGDYSYTSKGVKVRDNSGLLYTGREVIYDKFTPWKMEVEGADGKKHEVRMCGKKDLRAVVGE